MNKVKQFATKTKVFWQSNNILKNGIIANISILLLYLLCFCPKYQNSADIFMQNLLNSVSGSRLSRILFSNIIYGWILRIMYVIAPGGAWYYWAMALGTMVCLIIISCIIMKLNNAKTGLIIAVVVDLFVGYEAYLKPGYVKYAAILLITSVYSLYYLIVSEDTNRKKYIIISVVTGAFGSLVSFSIFKIYYGIYHLLMLTAILLMVGKKILDKQKLTTILIVVVGVVVISGVCRLIDYGNYKIRGWDNALDYRNAYEKMYSFGGGYFDKEVIVDELEIVEGNYWRLMSGFGVDMGQDDYEMLKVCVSMHMPVNFEDVVKFNRTVPLTWFNIGVFYLVIILMLFVSINHQNKKWVMGIAIVSLWVLVYTTRMLNAYNRDWMYYLTMLPVVVFLLFGIKDISVEYNRDIVVYLLVLSVVLYSKFAGTFVTSVNKDSVMDGLAQRQYELSMKEEPCEEDAEVLYMLDIDRYMDGFSVFEEYPMDLLSEYDYTVPKSIYSLIPSYSEHVTYDWNEVSDKRHVWLMNKGTRDVYDGDEYTFSYNK